jgi:preprotein translocase subunit SecD
MMIRDMRFNIYSHGVRGLAAVLLLTLMLAAGGGCKSGKEKDPSKYGKRDEASLRFHLEVNADGQESNGPITVGRQSPFELNVQKSPFLTEFQIEKAEVVDDVGGFAISLHLDKQGTFLLEQYTTGHKGRRIGIMAEFGQVRWIAAPVIMKRWADGKFVFTPDTTREEAERIVSGVNRVAFLVKKGRK